jgi:ubiquinone/menaquinone biosynthesis C-methylase UbiE
MILNRLEFVLMNNPIRAALQRHVEARRFLRMGGPLRGATALEIGCGRGVGVELILDVFGAATVDAFDLDPRMVAVAQRRLSSRGPSVRVWVGDAAAMKAPAGAYDAVFDFGIIHHVPNWRDVLVDVHRVLRPGGVLYAEEPLGGFLNHPLMHRLFAHPVRDRFDAADFRSALCASGLIPLREEQLWHAMFWFVAKKPVAAQTAAPNGGPAAPLGNSGVTEGPPSVSSR